MSRRRDVQSFQEARQAARRRARLLRAMDCLDERVRLAPLDREGLRASLDRFRDEARPVLADFADRVIDGCGVNDRLWALACRHGVERFIIWKEFPRE